MASTKRWFSFVLTVAILKSYSAGSKSGIWQKANMESCRDDIVVNDVRSLKRDGPSLWVGRLSIWSNTAVLRSPVMEALRQQYMTLEFWIARLLLQLLNATVSCALCNIVVIGDEVVSCEGWYVVVWVCRSASDG